jgi:hypothetical protein
MRERAGGGEVLAFSESEVLRALETVTTRRPGRLVLERGFASTSRGLALVNRLRADPSLAQLAIDIVAHDGENVRVATPHAPGAAFDSQPPGAPLDQRGTRRSPRIRIVDGFDILVDGNPVRVVDLSPLGAQVTSAGVLKPNQKVRVSLVDEMGAIRLVALVSWAAFELPRPPRQAPQYRVGLEFGDCDPDAVIAFALRHERAA